jgi:hypothetical protein
MRRQVRLLIAGAVALVSACESAPRDTAPGAARARATTTPTVDDYAVEIQEVAPCRAGTTCALRLRLVAHGDYKVNAEYPMKFVPTVAPGVVHETAGPFQLVDKTSGTLDVRFRADAPGTVTVAGTYKTAICTEEACFINDVAIARDVAVAAP